MARAWDPRKLWSMCEVGMSSSFSWEALSTGIFSKRGFAKKAYRKLEVILREDVERLGFRDEILRVSPGYARNYLVPKKLAVIATEERKALLDKELESALAVKMEERKKKTEQVQALKKILDRLTSNPVRFDRMSVPGGKLYGSITASDIIQQVREQNRIEITESALVMEGPIKTVGMHVLPLRYKVEGGKEYNLSVLVRSVEKGGSDEEPIEAKKTDESNA